MRRNSFNGTEHAAPPTGPAHSSTLSFFTVSNCTDGGGEVTSGQTCNNTCYVQTHTYTHTHTPHCVGLSGHTHTKLHGPIGEQQHTDMLRITEATARHDRKATTLIPECTIRGTLATPTSPHPHPIPPGVGGVCPKLS